MLLFFVSCSSLNHMSYSSTKSERVDLLSKSIVVKMPTPVHSQKDNYEEKLLKEGMYLMEVKISDAIPIWLTQILSELSIYNSSFSKYGRRNCINSVVILPLLFFVSLCLVVLCITFRFASWARLSVLLNVTARA